MNMNKNNRNKRDMMDDKAFIRAITRFRNGDQYLKNRNTNTIKPVCNTIWIEQKYGKKNRE